MSAFAAGSAGDGTAGAYGTEGFSTGGFVVDQLEVYVGPTAVVRLDELRVRPGSIVALVGPGGAGKTLLLRGLAGLQPTTGQLWLGDRPLAQRRAHERVRDGLAFVPQHGIEVDDLIVDELLDLPVGLAGRRRLMGRGAGPRAGRPWPLFDLFEHLPGLERVIEADIASVGAWERLAVSVALALRSGPHVVLLDEPAAGLGDVSIERLRASLRRIAATGVTLVVATRNLSLARSLADTMLAVGDGRVQPFSIGERAR